MGIPILIRQHLYSETVPGYVAGIQHMRQFTHVSSLHYPTLGCDIQGFLAMGLSVQYWPGWFQNFLAIWLAVPFGANGAHLGICTLPEKNLLCVWNKLFLGEIQFSQGRTRPVKSLWWQNVPMQESANEWKNLTIFKLRDLRKHNDKTSNSDVTIAKSDIEILEIFKNFKNISWRRAPLWRHK